jgi:hypothetical protein
MRKLVLVDPFENNPALKYGLMADGSTHAQVRFCLYRFFPTGDFGYRGVRARIVRTFSTVALPYCQYKIDIVN